MSFTVIMPIKSWDGAKSRLHADLDVRIALARAFAQDTLEAVRRTVEVSRVVVVTGSDDVRAYARSIGAVAISEPADPEPDPLGAAVRDGAAWVVDHHPDEGVAVIPSDLPALTSHDLAALLSQALNHPLAFVPDANGDGTTILTSQRPELLHAGYGPGSADRHRSFGAFEMQAPAGLRRDVDEYHELLEAQMIGLGPHTATAFSQLEQARSCA